jgi:hypothetical protein
MKQLALVLLIAVTTLSVSAQKDYRNDGRDRDKYDRYDKHNKHDRYDKFSRREKEEFRRQLERINHEYDSRILSIRRNPFIGHRVKDRKINELERERRIALNEYRARFYRQMDYAERGRNNRNNKW